MTDETLDENQDMADLTDEQIIHACRDRFKMVEEIESEWRKNFVEDLKFYSGDQWPGQVKADRETEGRPCLTVNRIPQFVRQITNDQRQNRPSIKVFPVGGGSDKDTAKIIQGLIKHIEYDSNAEMVYDTAFEGAAKGGRSFYRLITEYRNAMTFKQKITMKRFRNPLVVYFDPNSCEADGSDAVFCIISDKIKKDTFRKMYPGSKLASENDWKSAYGGATGGWLENDIVRVAEYYDKVFIKKEILQLSDGTACLAYRKGGDGSQILVDEKNTNLGFEDEAKTRPIRVLGRRTTLVPEIRWYKVTYDEILERRIIPGIYIPVIPVLGDEVDIDGEIKYEGVITHAKDSQRMLNFWVSAQTELIALAPKAPFIAAEGQIEGYEDVWGSANRKNHAVLPYNMVELNGAAAPPPQRQTFEPPVAAITAAKEQSADDMKATTGVYDAALGSGPGETSGIAIQRRNTQSQTSNFHFMDNFSRALRHGGRIILGWIPYVYDTADIEHIIREDGQHEMVKINQFFNEGQVKKIHDLTKGEYGIIIDSGPSYATQRQETAANMMQLAAKAPQLMNVAPDLIVKAMDFQGAEEIAERLRKTVPAQLLDDKNAPPIPAQAQATLNAQDAQIKLLTAELNKVTDTLKMKRFEIASREKIKAAELQVQIEIALAKMKSASAETLLEHQVALAELMSQKADLVEDQLSNPGTQVPGNNQQPTGAIPG